MTDGHLDAVALAEYDEGLLSADQGAAVRAHLAGCAACAATHARLGDISVRLRSAPERLPVPATVVTRIDEAMAAESSGAARPIRPLFDRVRPFLRYAPQTLGAAALVGAVAFVGYVGSDGADDSGDAEAGAGSLSSADAPAMAGDDVDLHAVEPGPPEAPAQRVDAAMLDAEIRAVVATVPLPATPQRDEATESDGTAAAGGRCGGRLAEELGRGLIGAVPTDLGRAGSVLVVVTGAGVRNAQGWVIPSCDATTADALADRTIRLD